jgi:hypothetical protein
MYAPSIYVIAAMMPADIIYGRNRRLKLTPEANAAMISELSASFEVKYITAIKTNSALNMFE